MIREIHEILEDIKKRQRSGSPAFYRMLENPEERERLHAWYKNQLLLEPEGTVMDLCNDVGTLIATGYNRIVIGDYGAYIEMGSEHMVFPNIKDKWSGTPNRPVKYIWMITKDSLETKVYYQKARVEYADYRPGMYYVHPEDVCKYEWKDKPIGDGTVFEPQRAKALGVRFSLLPQNKK